MLTPQALHEHGCRSDPWVQQRIAYWWFDLQLTTVEPGRCGAATVVTHTLQCERAPKASLQLRLAADGSIASATWSQAAELTQDSRLQVDLSCGALAPGGPEAIYRLVHRCVMNEAHRAGYTRLHGALVRVAGRTLAIVGPSGAGKTTIAIELGLSGAEVLSDEGILVRDQQALPLLRRLHVKDAARGRLPPQVFAGALRLPYSPPLWALDPGDFTRAPVRARHIDHLIVLGDRQRVASLKRLSVPAALAAILTDSATYASRTETLVRSQARLVHEVSRLAATTPVWRLCGHDGLRGRDQILRLVAATS